MAFRQKLDYSALFFRVPLSIFDARYLSGGGSKVVGEFSLTVLSTQASEYFLPLDLLVGIHSFSLVTDILALIYRRSLWSICRPQKVTCFLSVPIILEETAPHLRAVYW